MFEPRADYPEKYRPDVLILKLPFLKRNFLLGDFENHCNKVLGKPEKCIVVLGDSVEQPKGLSEQVKSQFVNREKC